MFTLASLRGFRFDLTYEGLKSHLHEDTKLIRECFDLTYEGLKSGLIQAIYNKNLGLVLTYEGLKLQLKIQSPTPPLNVWILPMRD